MRVSNRRTPASTGSYEGTVIGDRFQLAHAPTLLTRTASVAPIGFTRLKNERVGPIRAKDVPREAAYSFHVALQPVSADLWIDGKHVLTTTVRPGAIFLFDLASNPVSELHTSFDLLRFYISQASLDELSFDRGVRRSVGFKRCLAVHDRVMHGLASALVSQVEQANEPSALFIDHIGLAFHAHVTDVYGDGVGQAHAFSGGLSPWQLRRTTDFMLANLGGDPTIAQLAQQCGLSSGYFARAFRQTVGATPHQWLIKMRIERSRELLSQGGLALADVALACGFVDQSHFTRVFAKSEGCPPGQWRRLNAAGARR